MLKGRYEGQLDTLRREMGLATGDLTDSSVALAEREKVAQLRVETYFDGLIAGKTRLRPLPSALATLLREKLPYDIHDAGVNRAVEIASEAKAKADSAAPKGAVQRAPGGPPVPGLQVQPSAPAHGLPPGHPPTAPAPETKKP
jgi:hypothetical protein